MLRSFAIVKEKSELVTDGDGCGIWRRRFGLGNQDFRFGGRWLGELHAVWFVYSCRATRNSAFTSESWLPKRGLVSSVPLHLLCVFPPPFTTWRCFPRVCFCPLSGFTEVQRRLREREDYVCACIPALHLVLSSHQ